jgi:hypothetical protein
MQLASQEEQRLDRNKCLHLNHPNLDFPSPCLNQATSSSWPCRLPEIAARRQRLNNARWWLSTAAFYGPRAVFLLRFKEVGVSTMTRPHSSAGDGISSIGEPVHSHREYSTAQTNEKARQAKQRREVKKQSFKKSMCIYTMLQMQRVCVCGMLERRDPVMRISLQRQSRLAFE